MRYQESGRQRRNNFKIIDREIFVVGGGCDGLVGYEASCLVDPGQGLWCYLDPGGDGDLSTKHWRAAWDGVW